MSEIKSETAERAQAVPLLERLRSVPANAVLKINTPNPLGFDTESIPVGILCHEAAALLAADGKAGGEPYCHIYEYDSHFGLHREFYPREWNGLKPTRTVPVYTHPPQAAQVAQPLTEEQMTAMWRNAGEPCSWPDFVVHIRRTEAAHGIGKD